MRLVDDNVKTLHNLQVAKADIDQKRAVQSRCIDSAIGLVNNIVETACERAGDLSLMRLLSLMDLYRCYLQLAGDPEAELHEYMSSLSADNDAVLTQRLGDTELVSFERFISDSRLLSIAAAAASRESGDLVIAPPPLCLSANS